ncbi:MAG: phosphohistidine phosphatase SixA [Gammaproteobacteria bacterium]|jgi:phosphohistidine phosphatase|nr:phosphohistidine phosphatase SixA [Gammaproteobacteria bacterium]
MNLYLVRHGEAYSSEERFERPLNDRGKDEVQAIAQYLLTKDIKIKHIFHSQKVRAIETAEIIANTLGMMDKLAIMPDLSPDEDVYKLIGAVHELSESSLLVGHLPNLALLASFFLTGDIHSPRLSFSTASCALFEFQAPIWTLQWTIDPAAIKKHK